MGPTGKEIDEPGLIALVSIPLIHVPKGSEGISSHVERRDLEIFDSPNRKEDIGTELRTTDVSKL